MWVTQQTMWLSYLVVAGGGGGEELLVVEVVVELEGLEIRSINGPYTSSPLMVIQLQDQQSNLPVSVSSFPITVGGGGAAQVCSGPNCPGANGNNSVFSTITSAGGGGGGEANSMFQLLWWTTWWFRWWSW